MILFIYRQMHAYSKTVKSTVFVSPLRLPVTPKTLHVRQLRQSRPKLYRLLLESRRLFETELPCHFSQKHFLAVSFSEERQGDSPEVLPQGKVKKRVSRLSAVHADRAVVPAQVANPQSLHIENHLALHLLKPRPLVGYPVPGIPGEYFIGAEARCHDFGRGCCAGEMESSCNIEIHMSGLGVNSPQQLFFDLFYVIEGAIEQNQVELSAWIQCTQFLEGNSCCLAVGGILPERQIHQIYGLFLGKSEVEQPGNKRAVNSARKKHCYLGRVLRSTVENSTDASSYLSHALNQQFLDCCNNPFLAFRRFMKPDLPEVDLQYGPFGPKGLTVAKVYGYERIGRNLKELFLLACQPFSLVLHLPPLLILVIARSILHLLFSLQLFVGSTGQEQMVFSHPHQKTAFPEVVLHDEDLVPLDQNHSIVSSYLPQSLQNLFLRALASHQSPMQPLTVVLAVFLIEGRQVARLPHLPVEQKVRAWGVGRVAVKASEVERALNPKRKALFRHVRMRQQMIVRFVHVDQMRSHFIGPPLRETPHHICNDRLRQDELMLLDVLVEREDVLLWGRVVGREETEAEVVLLDGDVQHQTDSAHKQYL